MSEEFKKMILSKWKGKITYPFNYKDFEELTELIELFENQNKDLQQRIDKTCKFIIEEYYKEHTTPIENLCLENCTYNPSLVALSILKGKDVK